MTVRAIHDWWAMQCATIDQACAPKPSDAEQGKAAVAAVIIGGLWLAVRSMEELDNLPVCPDRDDKL